MQHLPDNPEQHLLEVRLPGHAQTRPHLPRLTVATGSGGGGAAALASSRGSASW